MARGRRRPDPAVNADSSAGNQQTLLLLTALIIVAVILLIVHRYREELRRDRGRDGGRAPLPPLAASAATVTCAMICLLAADSASLHGADRLLAPDPQAGRGWPGRIPRLGGHRRANRPPSRAGLRRGRGAARRGLRRPRASGCWSNQVIA